MTSRRLAQTGYNPFVIPVLAFPDMDPDPAIKKLARRARAFTSSGGTEQSDDRTSSRDHPEPPECRTSLSMERIGREVYAVTDGLIRLAEAGREGDQGKGRGANRIVPVGGRPQRPANHELRRCTCGFGTIIGIGTSSKGE